MKNKKYKKMLAVVIWSFFVIYFIASCYVNYYVPHGPIYLTGDVVCQNEGRGPCVETHKEDLRNLSISQWAKEFRIASWPPLLVLALLGFAASNKKEK